MTKMGYLKIVALQINLSIYVVGMLLFSAFHCMGFFKHFLVSFLSYVVFYSYFQNPFLFP